VQRLDWLIGPYPQEQARYRERSPLYDADRLAKPGPRARVKDLRMLHQFLPRARRITGYAASLKSPTCASRARLKAGRAVQRSI
jgi:hypothetical protein